MASLSEVQRMRAGKGISDDATQSYCLPREYYFDPRIHEREKEAIWYKNWIFAGTLNDLEKVGDYITRKILDQQIYVIRSEDGELRAFYNVCQHRGHTLLEGKGHAAKIQCPFHAWRYDTYGNLRSAPQSKHVIGFDCAEFPVPEIRLETLGMMVFINFDDDAPPLAEMGGRELLANFRAAIPRFDELKFLRYDPYSVSCNWKLVLDGLECYHCPYIHPEVMGPKSNLLENSFEFTGGKYVQQHVSRLKPDIAAGDTKTPFIIGGNDVGHIYVWFLWPNLLFAARPGDSNLQILETLPTSPETCEHNLINFCVNEVPTEADFSHMDFYRDVTFPEDREAMVRQMEGMKTRGFVRGRLMVDPEHSWWSEAGTYYFDKLVWDALNPSEAAPCHG